MIAFCILFTKDLNIVQGFMATLDNDKTFYRPNLFFYLRKL